MKSRKVFLKEIKCFAIELYSLFGYFAYLSSSAIGIRPYLIFSYRLYLDRDMGDLTFA